MIISHRYQFIFIKTHKTAGSSMEMALGPVCGESDIIPPMESNERSDIPRNYYEDSWLGRSYANSRLLRKCINRHSPLLGAWYYEHMPAIRVRELIGEKMWNRYHKFCYERNPWEKVVSYYNWKKFGQGRSLPSFREFVLTKTHRLPMDARLYFDGETCLVNETLDFKNFTHSFADLCKRLNIPYSGVMPREKTDITKSAVDYRTYYDDETSAVVARYFSREIRLMNYRFESNSINS